MSEERKKSLRSNKKKKGPGIEKKSPIFNPHACSTELRPTPQPRVTLLFPNQFQTQSAGQEEENKGVSSEIQVLQKEFCPSTSIAPNADHVQVGDLVDVSNNSDEEDDAHKSILNALRFNYQFGLREASAISDDVRSLQEELDAALLGEGSGSDSEELNFRQNNTQLRYRDINTTEQEIDRIQESTSNITGKQPNTKMATPGILETTTLEAVKMADSVEIARPQYVPCAMFRPSADSASNFVKNFERVSAANGWNYLHKIKYFGTFLEGTANSWYNRFQEDEINKNKTWTQIKQAFITRFSWGDEIKEKEEKLRTLRQETGENVRNYYYRLLEAMEETNKTYTDRETQLLFELGLRDVYKNSYALIATANMSEEELKEVVFRLSKITPIQDATTSASFFNPIRTMNAQPQPAVQHTRSSTQSENLHSFLPSRDFSGRPLCFRCSRYGHFQYECTSNPRPSQGNRRFCVCCRKSGHTESTCKYNWRNQDQRRNPPREEFGRYPTREENGRFSPPRESGRYSPRREGGRFSPWRENGRFSPRGESGRFSPRGENERFPPRGEYDQSTSRQDEGQNSSRRDQGRPQRGGRGGRGGFRGNRGNSPMRVTFDTEPGNTEGRF